MEISISFQDIWNYIKRRFWRLVVIVVLIAIAGGIVSAFAIPRTYTSASVVVISADVAESADPDYRNQYTGIISNRVSVGLAMVNGTEGEQMREEVASYLGIDPEHILTINATQMQGGPNIQIKTTTDLPELNAQISDAACEVLAQKLTEMLPSPPLKIEMIDHGQKASVSSTFGALAKGGVLCGALAVVVCFLFCVLRVLSDHRVRNSVELSSAAALPLFGEISASQKADHTEEMRRIRAALLQKAGGARLLLLVPAAGDVQGAFTANLARSIAGCGKKVLLVSTSLASKGQASLLGADASHTLWEVLSGNAAFEEAVSKTQVPTLSFLGAGETVPASAGELLASPAMASLLQQAQAAYDLVLLSSMPEIESAQADQLASLCDACVLIARYGATEYDDFYRAQRRLQTAGGNVIGFATTYTE